jgi:hypothetical protein
MKTVRIVRGESTDEGTFGVMTFGPNAVFTSELPWLDNLPHRSCIPTGSYPCHVVNSPHFGKAYGVFDTPDRSSVLIHPANFAGNVGRGWQTELEGCIAPSLKRGALRNKFGHLQRAGLVSRPAVTKLMSWAAGEPFTLEIS